MTMWFANRAGDALRASSSAREFNARNEHHHQLRHSATAAATVYSSSSSRAVSTTSAQAGKKAGGSTSGITVKQDTRDPEIEDQRFGACVRSQSDQVKQLAKQMAAMAQQQGLTPEDYKLYLITDRAGLTELKITFNNDQSGHKQERFQAALRKIEFDNPTLFRMNSKNNGCINFTFLSNDAHQHQNDFQLLITKLKEMTDSINLTQKHHDETLAHEQTAQGMLAQVKQIVPASTTATSPITAANVALVNRHLDEARKAAQSAVSSATAALEAAAKSPDDSQIQQLVKEASEKAKNAVLSADTTAQYVIVMQQQYNNANKLSSNAAIPALLLQHVKYMHDLLQYHIQGVDAAIASKNQQLQEHHEEMATACSEHLETYCTLNFSFIDPTPTEPTAPLQIMQAEVDKTITILAQLKQQTTPQLTAQQQQELQLLTAQYNAQLQVQLQQVQLAEAQEGFDATQSSQQQQQLRSAVAAWYAQRFGAAQAWVPAVTVDAAQRSLGAVQQQEMDVLQRHLQDISTSANTTYSTMRAKLPPAQQTTIPSDV